ncbi:polymeric immunoglobulin receptor-like isoform X2 [Trachinotus anak]|uniref:polymeric immunoglobulin receptor-like isoform X2 n=1 Tax=Trachinotus anak TaxID=443729 RepID=UPI0039F18883
MKMFAVTVMLLVVSQHALGVEVFEGVESVLLPCHVTDSVSNDSTVVWSREGLEDSIVHLRLQSGEDLRNQNQVYRSRTWMRTDSLQTGDLSLTLRKPTIRDSSTYTCTVRKFGLDQSRTEVQLTVREPPPPVWPQVLAAVLVLLVLLLVLSAVGFIVYKMWKDRQVQQVEVEEEAESVQLPCKIKDWSGVRAVRLSGDIRVEWRDRDNRKVHVNQNGSDRPEDQDQVYRDRTEMKEDLLRTGDLSLTLKHLRVTDTGEYTCRVYKDGNFMREKTVTLKVKGQQVEVEEGAESVQLPFKTTADLPEDAQVLWRNNDMKVHVYQNGSDRPEDQDQVYRDRTEMKEDLLRTGDLSLTLKHLRVRDTGDYTCRVYKDGNLLREKTVTLKVKETPLLHHVNHFLPDEVLRPTTFDLSAYRRFRSVAVDM